MATTTISGTTTRNNNGTVLLGGNVSSDGPISNAPDKSILGAGAVDQPKPQISAHTGAKKVVSAGVFAGGDQVMYGGNVTTDLAGVANTEMANTASDENRVSIHSITTRKSVLIDSWNFATGTPTYNASNPSDDDFGNDEASRPSLAVPGEFVYKIGATPTQADYPARTHG